MTMRLLVVEDSERLRRSLSEGLRRSGFTVDVAGDGVAALAQTRAEAYAVVVLDLMLPRLDGLQVLQNMRQHGDQTHVLILSAKDQLPDRVAGLNLGADDYLAKPFAFEELLARVNALIRRRSEAKNPLLKAADVEVDTNARSVRVAEAPIALSRLEYELLTLLLRRRGRVLTRSQIVEALYDSASDNVSNVVEALVYSLRRKLQPSAAEAAVGGSCSRRDIVVTRRGLGYVIEG